MIVTENIIENIVSQIPEIVIKQDDIVKPFFGFGDKSELNRTLEEYRSSVYPLVWLTPTKENYNARTNKTTKTCKFVIAQLEKNVEYFNKDRYRYNFKHILNICLSDLIHGLRNSGATRVTDLESIEIYKRPNYTEVDTKNSDKQEAVIDLWDAIELTIEVEFFNNCLKDIKWQKRQ